MTHVSRTLSMCMLAGALSLPGLASAQTVLRLAENQPDSNPVAEAMYRFAELVEEYTAGEIAVQVFTGAQLGQEPETIEQTQAGIIDLTRVNSVPLANVSQSMGAFTLPYVFRGWDHKYAVLDGEIGEEVLNDLEDVGLIGFGYMDAGTRSFYTTGEEPIESIDDLSGMKIRVQPSPISIRMVELLGAVPTPMNYGEVYSSLQTGVIDGAENDFVSYLTSAHYEVAPNYVTDGHLSPPALLLMNKARYDGLPDEHQEALSRAGREAALYEREIMREANAEARRTVEERGATVTEIESVPFQEAVTPIYEDFPELMPLVERIQAVEPAS